MEGERAVWGLGCVYHKSVPQIKKAEMDRKTLDWEIVELTNKLLDARNTINRLEELNVCSHPQDTLAGSRTLGLGTSGGAPSGGLGSKQLRVSRSGTGWTATWLCSSSSAISPTSGTTSLLM